MKSIFSKSTGLALIAMLAVPATGVAAQDQTGASAETRVDIVGQLPADLSELPEGPTIKGMIAAQVNQGVENIGARRLQTVMEKLLEEISFDAEEHEGETVTIDAEYVRERLTELADDTDLSKYIL